MSKRGRKRSEGKYYQKKKQNIKIWGGKKMYGELVELKAVETEAQLDCDGRWGEGRDKQVAP